MLVQDPFHDPVTHACTHPWTRENGCPPKLDKEMQRLADENKSLQQQLSDAHKDIIALNKIEIARLRQAIADTEARHAAVGLPPLGNAPKLNQQLDEIEAHQLSRAQQALHPSLSSTSDMSTSAE